MMDVVIAEPEDFPAWLILAKEVEPLFGPMVNEPSFHRALQKNIDRRTAFCVREANGSPGMPLLGGVLFSPKPPIYTIGWLAVAGEHRGFGIGQKIIEHVIEGVGKPAIIVVTTFGADNPDGEPARRFHERMGFHAAESAPDGPEGGSRQVFRRSIIE
jgi:GNAT superfamily N-acetyltransferase